MFELAVVVISTH